MSIFYLVPVSKIRWPDHGKWGEAGLGWVVPQALGVEGPALSLVLVHTNETYVCTCNVLTNMFLTEHPTYVKRTILTMHFDYLENAR